MAVLIGAVVQGSIGFGINLVAVPVVALIEPKALPATLVLLAFPLSVAMVQREHHAVDRRGVAWILVGRVPGTLLGAWIVTTVSADSLSIVVGTVVLVAVAISVFGDAIPVHAGSQVAAGVASGAMGTAAGIGGPPLALLYQRHDGPTIRATLAAAFLFGTMLSAATLAAAGQIGRGHLVFAFALTPATLCGSLFARRLTDALDRGWLRPAVLTYAAISAVIVVANGVR